jgi:RimJ/RimL family protein N-acetyltransferase
MEWNGAAASFWEIKRGRKRFSATRKNRDKRFASPLFPIGAPHMETQNLRLVPNTPQYLLSLFEGPGRYEQNIGFAPAEGLREFMGSASADVSPDFLARLQASTSPDIWTHGFALMHLPSQTVIGMGGYKGPPDAAGMVEIAYGIVPSHRNKGYATEAARALVAYAFNTGRVSIVRAHTLPEPNASTRVLAKCGFNRVGEVIDPEDGRVWRWEKHGAAAQRPDTPAASG